jgi:hypothetical protein
MFEDESAYESLSSLEPANHEFESYTRTSIASSITNINNNLKSTSVDYGFESSNNSTSPSTCSKLIPINSNNMSEAQKHSTLNVYQTNSNNLNKKLLHFITESYAESKLNHCQMIETNLYRKLLEKLQKSSIDMPANLPLLCVESFSRNDMIWSKLNARFISSGINIRLVEINKGR